jgi:hypothetical protein
MSNSDRPNMRWEDLKDHLYVETPFGKAIGVIGGVKYFESNTNPTHPQSHIRSKPTYVKITDIMIEIPTTSTGCGLMGKVHGIAKKLVCS